MTLNSLYCKATIFTHSLYISYTMFSRITYKTSRYASRIYSFKNRQFLDLPSMVWKNNFGSFESIMKYAFAIWKLQILFCKMLFHILTVFNHVFVNYFNGHFWHRARMMFHSCSFHTFNQRRVNLKGTRHVTNISSLHHGHKETARIFRVKIPKYKINYL